MIRFLKALILLPVAILVVLLAVANRAPVTLSLDPFSQDAPEFATQLPLFAVIFAAVMVGVFFSFALAEPLPPKEMGIILGVAVLLDAVLIRLILLPVLLRLTGHAAWWSPRWLRKVLPDISFAH